MYIYMCKNFPLELERGVGKIVLKMDDWIFQSSLKVV